LKLINPLHSSSLIAEAMDRIHRLGQHRPVHAIKLVVEDSIESRIVQVIQSLRCSPAVALTDLMSTAAGEEVSHG
jgi:hypothetical protein